jgi:hypothetical protein
MGTLVAGTTEHRQPAPSGARPGAESIPQQTVADTLKDLTEVGNVAESGRIAASHLTDPERTSASPQRETGWPLAAIFSVLFALMVAYLLGLIP